MILLAGLCLAGGLSPPAEAAATRLRLAFPALGPVSLFGTDGEFEDVDFLGEIHVTAILPQDPIRGSQDPIRLCRFHTNLVGVTGVGETSGVSYRVTGAAGVIQACAADTEINLTYRTIPQDPVIPVDPVRGFGLVTLKYLVEILQGAGQVSFITPTFEDD